MTPEMAIEFLRMLVTTSLLVTAPVLLAAILVGVVVSLLQAVTSIQEPTLSVSPWFEARRTEYYDRLLAVSARGAWDDWVAFFSSGLAASASSTHDQMVGLLRVRDDLLERVEASSLRSATALLAAAKGWAGE